MAVECGTVSHYHLLVTRQFINFMSLFRHSVWFALSLNQLSLAEFRICNLGLTITAEELSYRVVFCSKHKDNERRFKVESFQK